MVQLPGANAGSIVGVRDSKDPAGAVLAFTDTEWSSFLGAAHDGSFTRKS